MLRPRRDVWGRSERRTLQIKSHTAQDLKGLIEAVAKAARSTMGSQRKQRAIVMAKEALIIMGKELGGSHAALARLIYIVRLSVEVLNLERQE